MLAALLIWGASPGRGPSMSDCHAPPIWQELVLEIFKTLGSGNIIKDVPVRFRTKVRFRTNKRDESFKCLWVLSPRSSKAGHIKSCVCSWGASSHAMMRQ